MSRGYVYVLVNSSMPGLVKIGRTTRDPAKRVSELSGATGVATPFILAFKKEFYDCVAAEEQIHRMLESAGHRVSAGREFFKAEADEVIRLVMATARYSNQISEHHESDDDSDILLPMPDDEFRLIHEDTRQSWAAIFQDAENLRYGLNDEIENPAAALDLYKDAIRLGGIAGYGRIGWMYCIGAGVAPNTEKALSYFRTGAEKGDYYCWSHMADLFHRKEMDENATKCWNRFFQKRKNEISVELENWHDFLSIVCDCCVYCMLENDHQILFSHLRPLKSDIVRYCERERARSIVEGEAGDYSAGILRWVSSTEEMRASG